MYITRSGARKVNYLFRPLRYHRSWCVTEISQYQHQSFVFLEVYGVSGVITWKWGAQDRSFTHFPEGALNYPPFHGRLVLHFSFELTRPQFFFCFSSLDTRVPFFHEYFHKSNQFISQHFFFFFNQVGYIQVSCFNMLFLVFGITSTVPFFTLQLF